MTILDRLTTEILTGDGAVGTMLYARGIGLDSNFEHLNLVRPALVLELAREYAAAGAQVIETNTFGANHTKLAAIGLGTRSARSTGPGRASPGRRPGMATNSSPVRWAPGAHEGRGTGVDPRRHGRAFPGTVHRSGRRGVDLLLLETFGSLEQLVAAVRAARETGLPVCASMAFMEGGAAATARRWRRSAPPWKRPEPICWAPTAVPARWNWSRWCAAWRP
ncbi:homocysteine S-methyltransferase family protein [Geobacter sp. FeAm09]|uniref:homocysteine S-methyltransferase family protein n=1 Tax=Geobacter sp. FeAm09 TaxID=2597769 RepID=UPI001F0FDC06|nr:homocysteine S-methyltransferase family protein [Geobacter sp. FeAm09]